MYRGPKKNEQGNRKLTPQEAWMETIRSSLDGPIPSTIQGFIQQLSNMENVPRKENAFINFAINSLRLRNDSGKHTALSIWNHLSQARAKQTKNKIEATESKTGKQPEDTSRSTSLQSLSSIQWQEEVEEENKSRKSGSHPSSFICQSTPVDQNLKINVEKVMKKILKKQSPEHRLPLKQLKKKIKTKLRLKKMEFSKGEIKNSIIQSSMIKKEGKDILLL